MLSAAFVNAASGNVFDFDDTHHPTIIHPTAPVAPALFALRRDAAGHGRGAAACLRPRRRGRVPARQRGVALALPARLAHHVDLRRRSAPRRPRQDPRARRRTHDLGARQRVGAIVRAGRDARHDGEEHRRRRMRRAAGFRPRCSREAGVTGPAEPIAGPRGFTAVMGDAPDLDGITEGLGETWETAWRTPTSRTRAAWCCFR